MSKLYLAALFLLLMNGCNGHQNGQEQKALAEQYIRGVYGCDSTVVDNLAADSIIISYPIFEKLFNTPAIRGKEAVRHFVSHFCSRWKEPKYTFHEAIAESGKVVLVWSFKARFVGSQQTDVPPTNQLQKWGGITLIRFNEAGKITAEIGEESDPGPFERVAQDK
ncbi:MAG: nuclear transport factor 2 family protein [Ignavibacteriaceae bacterium]